jgi:hypothetical protein
VTDKPEKFWKGENKRSSLFNDKHKLKKIEKPPKKKVVLNAEKMRDGLAQLVLTVLELLRELMEKQAIRRIEAGSLKDEEIENLGNTFMALKLELNKLKEHFQLDDDDLNISLGPLMLREKEEIDDEKGQTSVVEILDRLLGKGVVVKGDIIISVAEVDLLSLNLGLLLASIDKAKELYGRDVRTAELEEEVAKLRKENLRLHRDK